MTRTTGATDAQIEAGAKGAYYHWGDGYETGKDYESLGRHAKAIWMEASEEVLKRACDTDHRIVRVALILRAWERITSQANISDADAELANELLAAIGEAE